MEALGAASSLITPVDLGIKTVKIIRNVTKLYIDAPSKLLALQHDVEGLQIQLFLLRYIQESVQADTLKLEKSEIDTIERFIEQTFPLLS